MKSRKVTTILSCVLVFSLFALLVWALDTSTSISNVALVSPIPVQNISGSFTVNISAAFFGNSGGNLTNATITFVNATSAYSQNTTGTYIVRDTDRTRNTSLSNITNSQEINLNGVLNTLNSQLGFTDGIYNISTITATNATNQSSKDVLTNSTLFKQPGTDNPANRSGLFIIDNTKPLGQAVNTTNSTVYNFTTNQNVSVVVTATNSTSFESFSGTTIHRVTFQVNNLTNSSGTVTYYNLTATNNATATDKQTVFNLSFAFNQTQNTKNDGNYSFTVYVNDTAGNLNNSLTGWFVLDSHAPNAVETYTQEHANLTSARLLFQVNDSISTNLGCDVYLWNGTISVLNTTGALNVSNGTTYNFTPSNTPADGNYNWSVQCNDSVKLQNNSAVGNFTVDNTPPVVTVTCTPSSVSAGSSVSCSCSATDASTKVSSTTFTDTSPSTATAGSFNTGTCNAKDIMGNSRDGTGSYSVTASDSSSGGGGAGGSGGGSSTSIASQLEKKTWTSILAGEKATVEVKNGDMGVTSVSFVMDKTTYGVSLEVKNVATLPTIVSAFADKVYKTLQISESNVEKGLSGTATVNFKVAKSWLSANTIDKSGVALFHFKDSKWVQLPTTPGSDDATYVYYSAQTPGFSYFVIGKTAQATAPSAVTAPVSGTAPTGVAQPAEAAGKAANIPAKSSSSTAVWVVVALVLVGLLVWVVMALRRRR